MRPTVHSPDSPAFIGESAKRQKNHMKEKKGRIKKKPKYDISFCLVESSRGFHRSALAYKTARPAEMFCLRLHSIICSYAHVRRMLM